MKNRVGIYIQVPFCQTKCTYCNFHTGVVSSARFAPFVDAVCREIATHRTLYATSGVTLPETFTGAVADTVYIGGGTPSLLDPALLRMLMDAIRTHLLTDLKEVTLEADPASVTLDALNGFREVGVNRLSFGVQSFQDHLLKTSCH